MFSKGLERPTPPRLEQHFRAVLSLEPAHQAPGVLPRPPGPLFKQESGGSHVTGPLHHMSPCLSWGPPGRDLTTSDTRTGRNPPPRGENPGLRPSDWGVNTFPSWIAVQNPDTLSLRCPVRDQTQKETSTRRKGPCLETRRFVTWKFSRKIVK